MFGRRESEKNLILCTNDARVRASRPPCAFLRSPLHLIYKNTTVLQLDLDDLSALNEKKPMSGGEGRNDGGGGQRTA